MKLSVFRGKTDRQPQAWECEWSELAERLTVFEFRGDKDGPLVSPAEYPSGARRAKKNVIQVHVLGLDLDDVTEDQVLEVLNGLDGLSLVYHTTWRHHEQGAAGIGRYRVFVQLSRPVLKEEWPEFWRKVIHLYGKGVVDPSTKDASRMFYWPSSPEGTEELVDAAVIEGEPLDVDEVLAYEMAPPKKAPSAASAVSATKRTWDEALAYEASPGEREATRMWLKERCDRIATISQDASIYKELNETAFFIATRIPHLLDEEEAEKAIWSALKLRRPNLDEVDPTRGVTYREKYAQIVMAAANDAREKSTPWFPDSDRIGLNEYGLARRCVLDNFGSMLFVPEWGKWMVWSGTHWVVDFETCISRRNVLQSLLKLKKTIDHIEDEAYARKLGALVQSSLKTAAVSSILRMMQTWSEMQASPQVFNRDDWLLNLANGVIDLRTGEMTEHDPQLYITKYVPVEFSPEAECPRWEKFVLECMDGDQELAEYLQHAVGYSLTGSVQEHCLFFLHGDGRNGKTTFINTIMDILGGVGEHSYANRGVSSLLMAKRYEGHPTEKTALFGSRVVAVPELEENRTWSEATLKELTGGESVTARRMREDFWSFRPTHKFWVSGNSKPRVRGTDDGIWSRLKLIPFEVSFRGREDRGLADKLRAELPGILTWAIIGAIEWFEQGLAEPSTVKEAVDEYRHDEDLVSQFVEDTIEWDDEGRLTRTQMRRLYDKWCMENGVDYDKLSAQAFTKRLRRIGFEECKVKGVRSWKGGRVKKAG